MSFSKLTPKWVEFCFRSLEFLLVGLLSSPSSFHPDIGQFFPCPSSVSEVFALSLTPWGLQGCHSFQKFSLFGRSHGRVRLFFLLFWSLRLKISLGCPFPNPFGLDSLVGLFLRDPLSKIGFFVVYLSAFLC